MIDEEDLGGFMIGDIFHWEIDRKGHVWIMRNMEETKAEALV